MDSLLATDERSTCGSKVVKGKSKACKPGRVVGFLPGGMHLMKLPFRNEIRDLSRAVGALHSPACSPAVELVFGPSLIPCSSAVPVPAHAPCLSARLLQGHTTASYQLRIAGRRGQRTRRWLRKEASAEGREGAARARQAAACGQLRGQLPALLPARCARIPPPAVLGALLAISSQKRICILRNKTHEFTQFKL